MGFFLLYTDWESSDDEAVIVFETNLCRVCVRVAVFDRDQADRILIKALRRIRENMGEVEEALAWLVGLIFEGRKLAPSSEPLVPDNDNQNINI